MKKNRGWNVSDIISQLSTIHICNASKVISKKLVLMNIISDIILTK